MKNRLRFDLPVTFTTRESPGGAVSTTADADTAEGDTGPDCGSRPAGVGSTRALALKDLRATVVRRAFAMADGRHVQCDPFGGVWVGPHYRPDTNRWEVTVAVPDEHGGVVSARSESYWDATHWVEHGRAAGAVGAFLRAVGAWVEALDRAGATVAPANGGVAALPVTYDEVAARA